MKRQKRSAREFTGVYEFPAYPFTANEILERLRSGLKQLHKGRATFKQIGLWTGQLENTAHYWWTQSFHPHLVALMCLLEQLSPRLRNDFIAKFCRTAPALDHPRFTHDLRNLVVLFRVLGRKSGLTLITGGTDVERTFVVTALGHGFKSFDKLGRSVAGLDIHRPSSFLPVSTIYYVEDVADAIQRAEIIDRVWPQIESSTAPLLLFNRVWSALPEKRSQIMSWARKRHVILAEERRQQFAQSRTGSPGPAQTLVISSTSACPGGIQLSAD